MRRQERVEPLRRHPIEGPLGTPAELFSGSSLRRVIDHVFAEADRLPRPGLDGKGHLAEVRAVDRLAAMRERAFQRAFGRACEGQAAVLGRMAQHDAASFGISGARVEHAIGKGPRQPRIVGAGAGARLRQRHLRSDHDGGIRVEERHAIGDRRHVPVGEGDQPPRSDQHLLAGRRLPEDLAVERAGLHVEPPVVIQELGLGQPKRLVVDEELDDLAVGHIADGLAGPREAEGVFAVNDRPGFMETVDEGAVLGVGAAFLRAAAHPQISVADRQHRFELREELRMKRLFDDAPLVGRIVAGRRPQPLMPDHRAVLSAAARKAGQSASSPRSFITR